jgi:hypothetical protein
MFVRTSRLAVITAVTFGLAFSAPAHADNQRLGFWKEYDANGDKDMKGKELKTLKKDHEPAYNRLVAFCDAALEKPKKHGVELPEDEKDAKKLKCKSNKVSSEYMKAWVDEVFEQNKNDTSEKEAANEAAK